jgi:hypothetical protein
VFRIRIRKFLGLGSESESIIICTDPDLDPAPDSFIKKQKNLKNLDFNCFVRGTITTVFVIFEDVNGPTVSTVISKQTKTKIICCLHLESH